MKIVNAKNKIRNLELQNMAEKMFGSLVKGVIDIEKEIMAVDAELHSDEEAWLLENGSEQKNIWGINLYPSKQGEDFIEFDSMMNLKPGMGNKSRYVEDEKIRERIIEIVNNIIIK